MRAFALAAAIGAGMLAISAAEARPWTDPSGRITFDAPANWTISVEQSGRFTYVIAGTANNECQFVATPNPNTASSSADAVFRTARNDAQFTDASWVALGNGVTPVFPDSSAHFLSRTRDDAGFWPVQRAELQGPERVVHAGLQLRPGMDLLGLCMTYGGADPVAVYDQVLRSMGHPNDEAFRADAERQAAEHAARAAAPPPAPPPPPEESRRRRN
jgi:hypothetical protein